MVWVRSVRISIRSLQQRSPQAGQQFFDAVDNLDDIGPGLTLNIQYYRRRGIGPSGLTAVLGVIDDIGDVREPNRSAVAIGDDQRRVIATGRELIVRANLKSLAFTVEISLGRLTFAAVMAGTDILQIEGVRR